MKPAAPTLWTWAASASLAIAILLGLAFDPAGRADQVEDLNLGRLNRAQTSGEPVVAIIGTSRAKCAVESDDTASARLAALGVKARIVRITQDSAVFADLKPAFERLNKLKPAVVLVEGDLFLFHRDQLPPPEIKSWRARASRALRVRSGVRGLLANDPRGGNRPCPSESPAAVLAQKDSYRASWERQQPSTPADRARYLTVMKRLKAHGAVVAIVRIPTSPIAQQIIPDRLSVPARQTIADLSSIEGQTVLAIPEQPPQPAYADLGHMNATGQQLYMAWLAPQIAALLQGRHD